MENKILLFLLCHIYIEGKVVDLTHPLNENTLYWPGYPQFNLTVLSAGWYNLTDGRAW